MGLGDAIRKHFLGYDELDMEVEKSLTPLERTAAGIIAANGGDPRQTEVWQRKRQELQSARQNK